MEGSNDSGHALAPATPIRWARNLTIGLGALIVLIAGTLYLGPFEFDEGPLWHANVVGFRDAVQDIALGEPHVLVIGDPSAASEDAAAFEERLLARGLRVRYTGDQTMTTWERKYVAVYWSIAGMVFDPPVG